MRCILFYTPFNMRSRDTESLMVAFRKQGYRVISLSQSEGKHIHPFLRAHGIETYSFVMNGRPGAWYYLRHLLYFIRFCHVHQVDVVYSHLESANFVAAMGQYFVPACVYICRHHIDEAKLYGFDRSLAYRLTYALAKKVVVVSGAAKRYMLVHEKISEDKIIHIRLAYDFSFYAEPDEEEAARIRQTLQSSVVLLTVCRLTRYKRPEVAIRILHKLVSQGVNAKLVLLGAGEERDNMLKLISTLGVQDSVVLPGFVNNVPDYFLASDIVVHPSVLESSCVVVKEAGLVRKPVVVCRGVGDFDEYIVHGENGFLCSKENFEDEAVTVVNMLSGNHAEQRRIGENLRTVIVNKFSIGDVVSYYDALNRCDK